MPKLLLHACCGPCSLMPLSVLRDEGWEVALFWFNPNIHPADEWLKRRDALREVAARFAVRLIEEGDIPNPADWVRGLGGVTEFGRRCTLCYRPRMVRTAELAAAEGFDAFTSTLLYSKYQNHENIMQEAEAGAARFGSTFLYRDFRPFWWDGINMSKDLGIYRQKWCGCILSMKEAELQQKEAAERKAAQKAERAARLAAEEEQRRKKKEAIAAKQAEKEQKRRERLEAKNSTAVEPSASKG
ncbi:MAG: epoxyqueuosine reductase QueH [Mailhella sp.]|nr:epoxyqueuosine reductase QueH [Mailhella sp.]